MIQVNEKYNQLILRFLQDEISLEDQRELDLWLAESSENQAYLNSIKKIWDFAPSEAVEEKEYDVEAALQKVHKRMDAIDNEHKIICKPNWFKRHYASVSSIAAVILIGIIITIFATRDNSMTNLTAEANQELTLPDDTHVTMNSDGVLSYSKDFNGSSREVSFEGSAYFDVTPNAEKPFIIKAGNMFVEVLGTTFDVNASKDSGQFIVDLHTGKVKMYSVDSEGNQMEQIILLPGERGVYNTENQRIERIYQSSNNNIFSIKTGILDFNNVSLSSVTQSLSKAYNIEIYLDPKYDNLKLTARFENETLESIFETIAAIFDLEIVRIGNTVTIR